MTIGKLITAICILGFTFFTFVVSMMGIHQAFKEWGLMDIADGALIIVVIFIALIISALVACAMQILIGKWVWGKKK